MEINDFRTHAHQLVDWMADYLEGVGAYPVRSGVKPGEVSATLPDQPPEAPESMTRIVADFKDLIVPGMMHWQHPGFFGYFPANSSPPSVLAEMLTATVAAQCMSWETSPAATELEMTVMEWLRDMLGLPGQFVGSIHDTASTATLVALLVARERASGGTANRDGADRSLTVYCSEEAHSSVAKAVRIAGLGNENLRRIPTDENQSMRVDALREVIQRDRESGRVPAAVVACLGTTGTGGFDPVEPVGGLCSELGIWLHVDAAWAGSALVLPEHRWMLEGIEHADSFVFNPHKWLFTNFDCSALFVRNPEELVRTMGILPEYLKTAQTDVVNYRDWSVPLGRRFRALKLWFVIRSYGVSGLQRMVGNHIEWAQELAGIIDAADDFELMTRPRLSLFCFRYHPPEVGPEALDDLNRDLLTRINADGRIYLTHTRIVGKYVIRFVAGQTRTTREHVRLVWDVVRDAAALLNPGGPSVRA